MSAVLTNPPTPSRQESPGLWALAWRRQDAAVAAIEERDGACFYVRRTSPLRPMELVRAPGFKASRPERVNGAVT